MSRRFTYVIKNRGLWRSVGEGNGAEPGLRPIPGAQGEAPSTNGVQMTTFAERKERSRRRLGGRTPSPADPTAGQQDPAGREGASVGQPGAERLLLRRRLEEKRLEIEAQVEAMAAMAARQRQKLGRRVFRDLMKVAGEEEGRTTAGRLLEGRGPASEEEDRRLPDGAEGLKSRGGVVSHYDSSMGRLNETLNTVQCELALLSFQEPRVPPAAGTGPGTALSVGQRDGGIELGNLAAGERRPARRSGRGQRNWRWTQRCGDGLCFFTDSSREPRR
ncbi:calmodulin-regulated spectrin-associated protein 3-like [Heptranchias perlo]|uniref:calmodulin-regulated spectrin-associated protein 3-like n=1 Tax=Heptranchias perlo TaxID=212740 RepID=UPI00355A8987